MPLKSYFGGFPAPNDSVKWKECQYRAYKGDQLLLSKALSQFKSPLDFITFDRNYKWTHRVSDYQLSKNGWLDELSHFKGIRAPISLFGIRKFAHSNFEGELVSQDSLNMDEILRNKNFEIPHKIVVIGSMDENWGWLSSYFLNRTVPWGFGFGNEKNPYANKYTYPLETIRKFLDNPNLVMLLVNQHNNVSHPKVISMPLGVIDPKGLWNTIHRASRTGVRKDQLFFSAGSNWAFRPTLRDCIAKNMGADMVINSRLSTEAFRMKLVSSYAVLAMPGMGYDTYRIWESLASGSMPVIERGVGLDRTVYKLPVLLVDDFYDINPEMLRQAYVEALYWSEEWEYERMLVKHWEYMLFEASETASDEVLQRLHPMSGVDTNFTRPLVPFDCESMGGCGPGTKRVPKKSCAIDPSVLSFSYNWIWDHSINDKK
eukprot:gene22397-29001_t